MLIGLAKEALQRGVPRRPVGLEDRELLRRGLAVHVRADVQIELRRAEHARHGPRVHWSTTPKVDPGHRPRGLA